MGWRISRESRSFKLRCTICKSCNFFANCKVIFFFLQFAFPFFDFPTHTAKICKPCVPSFRVASLVRASQVRAKPWICLQSNKARDMRALKRKHILQWYKTVVLRKRPFNEKRQTQLEICNIAENVFLGSAKQASHRSPAGQSAGENSCGFSRQLFIPRYPAP